MKRLVRRTVVSLAAVLAVLAPASGASAAASKASVLSNWTQTAASSYDQWNAARLDRTPWASYGFDWSTDYCSASPDNPLGFDFTLACWRHDFGYRNYKDMGTFSANKSRLDSAFYADLKRKCATYSAVVQPACYSLAWTYYEAVHIFGSLTAVQQKDIDRAAQMKRQAVAANR
ncbi:phospholipase [Mangrovihabitans endophyticus]|uniref:Phospholipase A2 n=1 Tax=Mangrovihabitans endophyticus TaxID=1751298 RepID=A0A8J3BYE7_9ACTN|nr:phospholipase [Mangrovihabitans endophyticus]GGK83364.1 hypothetical protein GCM10012284_16830 [Mangrovihabitans endophyticus]